MADVLIQDVALTTTPTVDTKMPAYDGSYKILRTNSDNNAA